MIKFIKKLFCKHDDEFVRKTGEYRSLAGDMIYKRCKRCGRIKEYGFYTIEEQMYLWY